VGASILELVYSVGVGAGLTVAAVAVMMFLGEMAMFPNIQRKYLVMICVGSAVLIALLMLGGCAELKTLHHACKDGLCR
jgi:hypothetical protein